VRAGEPAEEPDGRLNGLAGRVERGEGSAGCLLNDPALQEELSGALNQLRGLLSDVRSDPRKYLRLKLSLF
jgi:phospholipid/cholesterol/gamma-HCH transport system substrate-binding protein